MLDNHKKQTTGGESAEVSAVASKPVKQANTATVAGKKQTKVKALGKQRRKRVARPYPASSFEEALKLAEAIQKIAGGGKVRRLTLCEQMKISPTSSGTKMLITNSGKYGITKGSYIAEFLELTPDGNLASNPDVPAKEQLKARFRLSIDSIKPFKMIYDEYMGKKLPTQAVIKDFVRSTATDVDDVDECIDTFIVNAKFLKLLRTIAGSEVLIPIDQAVEEAPGTASSISVVEAGTSVIGAAGKAAGVEKPAWTKICFYISPIGKEGSEERKHSDLFLNSIIEPALKEFDLKVVRADKIGEAGMITSQILEHILKSKLVIVDLSFHNPNVFYELAIRHTSRLPIVQIIRKSDKLPFDVDQIRTIQIDNSDIYTLIPQLETYKSEIATYVRQSLKTPDAVSTPLSVFCPGFKVTLPE